MANPWDNDPIVGGKTSSPEEFAKVYGPVAERIGKAINVDPKIVLGQLGLETGWGKSIIPGTNNLGNIKDFAGGGVAATDNMTGSRDKYRAYATPEEFADDYASLIQRKYPNAVGAGTDPAKFTTGLKGYAEDPRYPAKVATATRIATAASAPAAAPAPAVAAGNPWDNDPIVEASSAPAAAPSAPKREATQGEKIIQTLAAVTSPAGGLIDAATGGKASVGAARGMKDVLDTGAELLARGYDKLTGNGPNVSGLVTGQPQGEYARIKAMDDAAKADFEQTYGDSTAASLGRVGGNIAATYPIGGILGSGARAVGLNRLAMALQTGGATTGAPVAAGIVPATANMLTRMAGGAITGGASAGLVNPESAGTGALIGAAVPPVIGGIGKVANAAGAVIRPFTTSGQNQIAGNTLREFATDPAAARAALLASREVVPGSAPTSAMAAGDTGLASLSRAMQNASPEYAAELAARQTAQNQARTGVLESIAGNTGKLDIAKAARDAATGPIREQALNAAGRVPAQGILGQIDNLIADPSNAGQLSQQALNQFKAQISKNVKDGTIDARSLYAIRKDINDVLGGKLQGEAGNLRYAASQLSGVKGFIDDAIDQASRSLPPNAIGPTTRGTPDWKGYLRKYAEESVPINQMEKLEDVLKSIQTGTVDSQGSAVISAAKLNNILKNQGSDLAKSLSPSQLQILRNIQADLNAGQLAANSGRAVGSNTMQNLAQNQLMQGALGRTLGGSTVAQSTLGRLLQLPYGTANKQIQERLGNALLNPQEGARLLADPQSNALLQALTQSAIPYRAAPVISAR